MRETIENSAQYAWIPWTIATGLVAGLGGYVIAVESSRSSPAPSAYTAPAPAAAGTTNAASIATSNNDAQINAYRDILARDPKNIQAAIGAGNLLYDAQRYPEAIAFYQ